MTQLAQGPPTIPKSGEVSPMSGPENTATVEGDDSDIMDVQVRVAAPWQYSYAHYTSWKWRGAPSSLTYTYVLLSDTGST